RVSPRNASQPPPKREPFPRRKTHQQPNRKVSNTYMKTTPQNKTQRPNCTAAPRGAFLLLGVLASLALAGRSVAQIVSGNISPNSLEIDLPSANLQPSGAAGFVDWIKDSLPNTDTPSLVNSIATGIAPGVTGATGGKGHW